MGIYSELYHKKTNEDPKTSTIFETLLSLPDDIFWHIIRDSSRTFKNKIADDAGTLRTFEFWPKWNPENTSNISYVEPDIFIRFDNLDLIVEAKYSEESGQFREEWEREIQAYRNEYSNDCKDFYLLAIGGNADVRDEEVDGCKILKVDWIDILKHVKKNRSIYETTVSNKSKTSVQRIFELIINGFHIMEVNEYMEKADLSALKQINTLVHMFSEVCNKTEEDDFCLSKYSASAATDRYIYQFYVEIKNNPKKNIYLGLGMWYTYGGLIAIEAGPEDGWAKPLVALIEKKEKFEHKYLAEPYPDGGKYYFEPTDKFYEDFEKADSYDKQAAILKDFVYGLIREYIKKI